MEDRNPRLNKTFYYTHTAAKVSVFKPDSMVLRDFQQFIKPAFAVVQLPPGLADAMYNYNAPLLLTTDPEYFDLWATTAYDQDFIGRGLITAAAKQQDTITLRRTDGVEVSYEPGTFKRLAIQAYAQLCQYQYHPTILRV